MKTTTWKTINIGYTKDYLKELKKAGINVSSYATDMLTKLPKQKKELVTLVKMTVRELGFDSYSTTKELFTRIKDIGELCPAEVGPALRLVYQDQPENEWLRIAMEPITDSGGNPRVFDLGRDGDGLWLSSSWAYPGREWNPDCKFVFRLRKSLDSSETSGDLDSSDALTLAIDQVKSAGYEVYKRM